MHYISRAAIFFSVGMIVLGSLCTAPVFAEVGVGIRGGMLFPDQDPFKEEFDSDVILGGVLEFDSNLGLSLEATVEYYEQNSDNDSLGGDITIVPVLVTAKYNFLPRYRSTPFVGIGAGTYFFDRSFDDGSSKSQTRFGVRVCGGLRFFEDRGLNIVLEGSRNFVDFDNDNASSYQVMLGLVFDLNPAIIGGP
ncbi:outer membrane beta-barrel protein [candidate division KSB3 bacterium]|uniref:Outer membrane beta-barrel protein n=1 Tax=candidate division KSB3 bacterium TaxID=2044937 RepID=A0A9D5Q6E2_9BACT|nr:outer membrane beta-barrel protein [candidate division KSB3 bacterium]MBD3325167.1 outer membrane beta-barrel protein [candidate division KSB3 bacterium]